MFGSEINARQRSHPKKALVGLFAVGALLLSGMAGPAQADEVPGLDLDTIQQRMTDAGVDSATQEALIAKLLAGDAWDSMNGAAPINETVTTEDGYEKTFLTFADGSYAIHSVQIPVPLEEGLANRSVTGCVNGAGAGRFPFWGCRVATDQALFSIDYYMDGYKGTSGTWWSSITSVYDLGYWTGAATVNSTSLSIVKGTQNSSGPAYARATLYVTFLLGSGSGTYKLTGYVNYSSIYDTSP